MKLTKPWDFEAWFQDLKAKGLDTTEEAARKLFMSFLDFAEQSVKLTSTPFDDIFLVGLPELQKQGLLAIDKINGKVD